MFDIGFQEMVLIGVLALLVFGPSKLPELGRMLGRAMRELRRASDEFRTTVETNLHINEDPLPAPVAEPAPVTAELPSEREPLAPEAAPAAPAPPAEAPAEPYVARHGARLFHRRDCAWVARLPEADRVGYKRVADARDQGLAPCPVCDPWEPAEPS